MTCRVVNLRKSTYTVYIGRSGKGQDGYFGNPFTVAECGDQAIPLFKSYMLKRIQDDPEYASRLIALKDSILGCFCKPNRCHGDVIAEWVNHFHTPRQPSLF